MRYNLYTVGDDFVEESEWVYSKYGKAGQYRSTKVGSPFAYDPINTLEGGILNCKRHAIGTFGTYTGVSGCEYYLVPESHWLFTAESMLSLNALLEHEGKFVAHKTFYYIKKEFKKLNPNSDEFKKI